MPSYNLPAGTNTVKQVNTVNTVKIHARTGFIVEGKLAFLYSVDENQRMQTTLTTYDNCTVLVIKLEERCVEESVER